jgi:hypothetical protein
MHKDLEHNKKDDDVLFKENMLGTSEIKDGGTNSDIIQM